MARAGTIQPSTWVAGMSMRVGRAPGFGSHTPPMFSAVNGT